MQVLFSTLDVLAGWLITQIVKLQVRSEYQNFWVYHGNQKP